MQKKNRVLLVGGGSGGHIIPNLAIASALRSDCGSDSGSNDRVSGGSNCGCNNGSTIELLYIGSRNGFDKKLVDAANLPFKGIFAGKIRRYITWRNLDLLFTVVGFFQSLWILIRFWPRVVFSKGGYISVPVVLAAYVLRRPIILHESDSVMGLANRVVSRLANQVCISFPGVIKNSQKTVFTGNPIRLEIQQGDSEKGYRLTGLNPKKPTLLVWGGSQGAQEVNEMILREFEEIESIFQVIHITGKGKKTTFKHPYYWQREYIGPELKHIYAIVDVVFSRAGANSLYELAFMKKPNILLPLQNADQLSNAAYFETEGASLILRKEKNLSEMLRVLWHNQKKRDTMKEALSKLAKPDASEDIATLIRSFF